MSYSKHPVCRHTSGLRLNHSLRVRHDHLQRQPNASIEKKPPRGSGSAGGIDDDDEDSDPELQEVYVQAYACQIFSDTAAARAVEDGAHLRPLTISQVLSEVMSVGLGSRPCFLFAGF